MSCTSSSSTKEKENQKKKNIKSRKIDKKKRKMSVSKYTITWTVPEFNSIVQTIKKE